MDLEAIKTIMIKRKHLIEEGLTEFGGREQKSMSQEEVITWLGYKAQWNLLGEILGEVADGEKKDYIEERKRE